MPNIVKHISQGVPKGTALIGKVPLVKVCRKQGCNIKLALDPTSQHLRGGLGYRALTFLVRGPLS